VVEIDTAVWSGIPFVAVIGNDGLWNAEVQIQKRLGGSELECLKMGLVRYDRVVEALGGHGEFVERPTDLDAAFRRAIESGKPSLINVVVEGVPAETTVVNNYLITELIVNKPSF